jgi:hypothetical protein
MFHPSLGLNQWMGFARNWGAASARDAALVENALRVGVPAAAGGAGYAGSRTRKRNWGTVMAQAICLRCGKQKQAPWEKCNRCGYDPSGDEEALIRSVYLSVGRFTEPERKATYRTELDRMGLALERGEQVIFPDAELTRLRAKKKSFNSIPRSAVWGAVLRLFLPAMGLLLLLFVAAYLLRIYR